MKYIVTKQTFYSPEALVNMDSTDLTEAVSLKEAVKVVNQTTLATNEKLIVTVYENNDRELQNPIGTFASKDFLAR